MLLRETFSAPFTRRAWWDVRFCATGAMTGIAGFAVVTATLVPALVISASIAGAGCTIVDAWLTRSLLGPSRVSELERTRAIAVEDTAAALRHLERDLHDGAQVRLAAVAMNLGMAQEKAGDDALRELLDAAQAGVSGALADLRRLARGIHPPVLDSGLADALASLAATSPIPVRVRADLPQRPSAAIETMAYFCAAELLANAIKHSSASVIEIVIHTERSRLLRVQVTDDGRGGADPSRGTGLAGLAQRASTVDGTLRVQPARRPDHGDRRAARAAAQGRRLMRVVIAEDAAVLREGLARLLADHGHQACAAVADAEALLAAVAQHAPDVVIADIRMPPTHTDEGLRAAVAIRRDFPSTGVLLFSQYIETRYTARLLESGTGGVGYLLKERVGECRRLHLRTGTGRRRRHRARPGGDRPAAAQRLNGPAADPGLASLTPRERQVLELMAEGRSNAGIAGKLTLSQGAVEKHIATIFGKLSLEPEAADNRRVLAVLRHLSA